MRGRLAHACAGRTRLSFAALKGDTVALTALCDATLALPGVSRVEGRPATGSLIVAHEGPAADLIAAAAAAGVFEVERPAAGGGSAPATSIEAMLAAALSGVGGPAGLARGGAVAAFLAMAAVQASRGNLMPPAATALWYAASLALGAKDGTGTDPAGDA